MQPRTMIGFVVFALLFGASTIQAQSLIRVPQDANLQNAINQVSNGGVVEVSSGTYNAPAGAFRIRFVGKSFTIRAAAGATVILSGQNGTDILRIADSSLGRVISLQGLTFRNGLSTQEAFAGAVTVDSAEVVFSGCTFADNASAAPSTGGGALRITDGAKVTINSSLLEDNFAQRRAGAIELVDSDLTVSSSRFLRNRANLGNHNAGSSGGAIHVLDSTASIQTSRFEGNQASFTGGAIFVFGIWDINDPSGNSGEAADVTVTNSTFIGNLLASQPCCPSPGTTTGGAIHVEDQARVRVFTSRFRENKANTGGAIDNYRGILEVHDSVFQGNQGEFGPGEGGFGGAIFHSAADFADASTGFGTFNRRSGSTEIHGSLLQGRTATVPTVGVQGGCLLASGDVNREGGVGGVAQNGTTAQNRADILITGTVFADCDVTQSSNGTGAFGGGISLLLADLTMDDSMIVDSDALGATGSAGALGSLGDDKITLSNSSFAGNSALQRGGAILANGADIDIDGCSFFDNDVSPGTNETVQQSQGAALYLIPANGDGRKMTGEVRNSTFIGNQGIAILDLDFTNGPINDVVYNGNQFRETFFPGREVYRNTINALAGRTAAELNSFVTVRANGTNTAKSTGGNVALATTPRLGQVLAAPSQIFSNAAPGDPTPTPAYLGFAWSGNNATLAGSNLGAKGGVVEVNAAGDYPLRVNNTVTDTVTIEEDPCPEGTLCLDNQRFQISVIWRDFEGNTGSGEVVPFATSDSGIFFFFNEDNWELLIKVLNGCALTDHFWVFSAATTTVEYTLTVTDVLGGASKTYFNPLGTAAPAVTDTFALPTCAAGDEPFAEPQAVLAELGEVLQSSARAPVATDHGVDFSKMADCTESDTEMCINRDRFKVEVNWRDFDGNTGPGRVVPGVPADDSGLFFFFGEDNWEILVKILNGCGLNQRYWVFAAATTTVEYTLTVTDTMTGIVKQYMNPLGAASDAITDTDALATCP